MAGRRIERDERDGPQHRIGHEVSGKPGFGRTERTDHLAEHGNRGKTGNGGIGTSRRTGVAVLRVAITGFAIVAVGTACMGVPTGIGVSCSGQGNAQEGIGAWERDLDGRPVADEGEHRQEGEGKHPGGKPPGSWSGRSGKEDSKAHDLPKIGGGLVGSKAIRPPKLTRKARGPGPRG